MTHSARLPRLACLALAVVLALALPARAEDGAQPTAPPAGWVARVGDKYLTKESLANAAVWRVMSELKEMGSSPFTILRQVVQEMVVAQEARRLGLGVTDDELRRKYDELDTEVRRRTNGAKNLEEVIVREQGTTVEEFMTTLRHLMLKEKVAGHQEYLGLLPKDEGAKLAQIEVVISNLLNKAVVEYGIPTAVQPEPVDLGPGVIAKVNGEPLTHQEFGQQLLLRLPTRNVLDLIQEECRAVLTTAWALDAAQMDALIEREKERWLQHREMSTQEAFRTVSYEDYVKMQFKLDLDGLKRDRYFRGLYGLIEAYRRQVTDEQIQKEYEKEKEAMFGDRFLVTDIQIAFAAQPGLLGPSSGRSRRDALKLANDILRQSSIGVPFDQIARDLNQKRDPTFYSRRLQVRNSGNGRHLYEQAKLLQDGQVSRPFETLAEVHIIRREKWIAAPTFDEVTDLIRQRLAFEEARKWLEQEMGNAAKVEIRWPPKTP